MSGVGNVVFAGLCAAISVAMLVAWFIAARPVRFPAVEWAGMTMVGLMVSCIIFGVIVLVR